MRSTLAILLILSGLLISSTPSQDQAPELVVVVNVNNTVSMMTASEVKLIWLRKIKKRWPALKKNIKPVDRKNTCPERDIFYGKILNMSAEEVESYFIQKQYQNAEKPSDKFGTEKEIIEFIANEPGAIGFVSAAAAAANKDKVRVVFSL